MATLAQQLLLLAFHNETGRNKVSNLEYGLAGATLLDLTLAKRIDLSGRNIEVIDSRPTGESVPDEVLQRIDQSRPRRPKSWVTKLYSGMRTKVAQSLTEQHVLYHRKDTVLGLFPLNRYLPHDPSVEADTRDRLTCAIDTGTAPDEYVASLAAMVRALKMERHVFPQRKARATRKALDEVAQKSWASEATKKAIEAAQAATTAVIAATASSNGGGS